MPRGTERGLRGLWPLRQCSGLPRNSRQPLVERRPVFVLHVSGIDEAARPDLVRERRGHVQDAPRGCRIDSTPGQVDPTAAQPASGPNE